MFRHLTDVTQVWKMSSTIAASLACCICYGALYCCVCVALWVAVGTCWQGLWLILFQRKCLTPWTRQSTCCVWDWCACCWTPVASTLTRGPARRNWTASSPTFRYSSLIRWGMLPYAESLKLDRICKIQTRKRFKRMPFIRTKQNVHIFEVIPFIKLQNST